ncbi:twin-arginine translocase subunit TatB [Novosphingobium umbonatum]|uniref:Twin-arginine translocase subunit TatB n=1 Tax=Novosphingobium umbonatum TaxID=1908524 RepID=A0A437NCW3_9SPHN|nr:Sec-independent protein translocase protein TatB [Novosphingobium umbonatum]RVU07642.1 twin-arginine translocase subunit TatB [Novosphingobium umbonatum]
MFLDIAPSEFLLTAIVAVVVIGPKDMPRAMRTMGRWMGTVRRVSGHFRSGIETMIREAEMEEMEKKWREQNEAIMKAHPAPDPALPAPLAEHAPSEPLSAAEEAGDLPVDPHSAAAKEVAHDAEQPAHAPTPQQGQ